MVYLIDRMGWRTLQEANQSNQSQTRRVERRASTII
jgi:hypothetical protein